MMPATTTAVTPPLLLGGSFFPAPSGSYEQRTAASPGSTAPFIAAVMHQAPTPHRSSTAPFIAAGMQQTLKPQQGTASASFASVVAGGAAARPAPMPPTDGIMSTAAPAPHSVSSPTGSWPVAVPFATPQVAASTLSSVGRGLPQPYARAVDPASAAPPAHPLFYAQSPAAQHERLHEAASDGLGVGYGPAPPATSEFGGGTLLKASLPHPQAEPFSSTSGVRQGDSAAVISGETFSQEFESRYPVGGDVWDMPYFSHPAGATGAGAGSHHSIDQRRDASSAGGSRAISLLERGFRQPTAAHSGIRAAVGAAIGAAGRALGLGPVADTERPSRPTSSIAKALSEALLSGSNAQTLMEPSVAEVVRIMLDEYDDANTRERNQAFHREVDEMVAVARVALRLIMDDAAAAAGGPGDHACPAAVLVLWPLTVRLVQYSWLRGSDARSASDMAALVDETAVAWTGTLFGTAGRPGSSNAGALRAGAADVLSLAAAESGQHPLRAQLRDAIDKLTALDDGHLPTVWRQQLWAHARSSFFLLLLQLTGAMLDPGCTIGRSGTGAANSPSSLPDPLRRVWGVPDVHAPHDMQQPYAGAWLVRARRMTAGPKDRPSPARLLEVLVAVSEAGGWGLPASAILRVLLDAGADAARAIGDAAHDVSGRASAAIEFASELLLSPAAVALLHAGYDGAAQGLDALIASAASGGRETAVVLGKLVATLNNANSEDATALAARVESAFVDSLIQAATGAGGHQSGRAYVVQRQQQQQQQVADGRLSASLEAFQEAACQTSVSRTQWGAALRDRLGGGAGRSVAHHTSDALLKQLEPAVMARLPLTVVGSAAALAGAAASAAGIAARYLRLRIEVALPRSDASREQLTSLLAPILDMHCAAPPQIPDTSGGATGMSTRAFLMPLLETLRGLLQATAGSMDMDAYQHAIPFVLGFCLRAPTFCRTASGSWWSPEAAHAAVLEVLQDRQFSLPRPAGGSSVLLNRFVRDLFAHEERVFVARAAEGTPTLPPPYVALASAYGSAIAALSRGAAASATVSGLRTVLDARLEAARDCLPRDFSTASNAALPLSVPVACFLRSLLGDCTAYLSHADVRFSPPAQLQAFGNSALMRVLAHPSSRQSTPLLRLFAGSGTAPAAAADGSTSAAVLPALQSVAAAVCSALVDIGTERLTRAELEGLRQPGAAERFQSIATALEPFMQMPAGETVDMFLAYVSPDALDGMAAEYASIDDHRPVLAATIGFLRSRRLLSPDAAELPLRGQPTDVLSGEWGRGGRRMHLAALSTPSHLCRPQDGFSYRAAPHLGRHNDARGARVLCRPGQRDLQCAIRRRARSGACAGRRQSEVNDTPDVCRGRSAARQPCVVGRQSGRRRR